ncbi:MAG: PQQ-binding-like beta-propeller repeat protein [Deltaproteobacteria bacterium]|nr:PQQ-binding-like beta-propeller repeat protein [Deltaproteobacteria bacterium]
MESRPAISGDTVILGDSDGMVYALDAASGFARWTFEASGEIMGTPLVDGGRLYFMTTFNRVYAVDLKSGEWLWTHQRDIPPTFTVRGVASPVTDGRLIYACFSDGYVVALNPQDGKENWKNLLKIDERLADVDTTPVLDGDSIYVAAYDGALYRLKRENGEVVWKYDRGGSVSAPALSGDYLFVGTSAGFLAAVDKTSGQNVWSLDLRDKDKEHSLAGEPRRRLKVPSAPFASGGVVLTATSQGFLYAADARTGAVLWRYFPGNGVNGGFEVSGDRLFFVGNGASVFAFRLRERGGAS